MTMHECESIELVTCGSCGAQWCERCDPAPSALCHTCHGRGYSTAEITPGRTASDEVQRYLSLHDIADLLDVKPSAMSNYRRRKSAPFTLPPCDAKVGTRELWLPQSLAPLVADRIARIVSAAERKGIAL